jgi:hypothetical protein
MTDLKSQLLTASFEQKVVAIPRIGDSVIVRALSRAEVMDLRKTLKDDEDTSNLEFESKVIAAGMVEPQMSIKDVKVWQKSSPAGELDAVVTAIMELSGMGEGAQKSGVSAVRE